MSTSSGLSNSNLPNENTNDSSNVIISTVLITTCSIVCTLTLFILYNKRSNNNGKETNLNNDNQERIISNCQDIKQYEVGQPHPYTFESIYNGCIYLDYNATTPIYPEVYSKMIPYLTNCFGNPSSSHIFSKPCRNALLAARLNIGRLINAADSLNEIYFTSCGTESDNRAIDIAIHHFQQQMKKKDITSNNNSSSSNEKKVVTVVIPHIISCFTEHPAVICYLRILRDQGVITMTVLPCNEEGFIDSQLVKNALTVNTALVTIMHSNNEVGTIQPIREIAKHIKQFNQQHQVNILLHSDAAQSLGKVLLNVQSLQVDMLTIVGHKFGAPKGISALYIHPSVETLPILVGGGQERGLRGGTENVALAVGLGEASVIALKEAYLMLIHLLTLKHRFIEALLKGISKVDNIRFNGPKRCNNPKEILSDLKILKVMINSKHNSNNKHTSNTTTTTNDRKNMNENNNNFMKQIDDSIMEQLIIFQGSEILEQLPNTISVSFKNIKSYELIELLGDKTSTLLLIYDNCYIVCNIPTDMVACSAGSACHATTQNEKGEIHISDVLKAMHVPIEFATGTLRLTFGRHSTIKDIDNAALCIIQHVHQLWNINN